MPWKCRRLYRVAPGVVNRAGGLPTRSAAAVVLAVVGAAALALLGFVLTEPGAAEIRARGGRLARVDVLGRSGSAAPVEELRLVSTSLPYAWSSVRRGRTVAGQKSKTI